MTPSETHGIELQVCQRCGHIEAMHEDRFFEDLTSERRPCTWEQLHFDDRNDTRGTYSCECENFISPSAIR